MPCFNARPFVERAVTSALEQDYPNVELVVVDDGSTDGSREILAELAAKYGDRMSIRHQQNRGPYPARNEGLRHARGSLIAFLDADDYWAADCLTKLYGALTESGADLAYCGWQNVGEHVPGAEPYVPPEYEAGDIVAHFLKACPWPIHAALTRRALLDRVDGFSVRRFTSMDYDLWLRIIEVTRKVVRVPEVLAYYRWHPNGQISSVKWRQVLDAWQVRREFAQRNPELVAHFNAQTRRELLDGVLLKAGYVAYWKRDLVSAHQLFRKAALHGTWRLKDARYLFPSLLPFAPYKRLIQTADRLKQGRLGALCPHLAAAYDPRHIREGNTILSASNPAQVAEGGAPGVATPTTLITVALCTHNHRDRLVQTLANLRELDLPSHPSELLVIDNASTDGTSELLADRTLRRDDWPTRIVQESRVGLSSARNRAIREAAGQYIFFMDDDETPDAQWLTTFERAILAHRPDALGGRIQVLFEDGERPAWVTDEILGFLGQLDHGGDERFLTDPTTPIYGGNFGFRLAIFSQIGDFDARLGRLGAKNIGGEDTEIYRRMLAKGCSVFWVPDAVIHHRIQSDKLRRGYFIDLHFRQGRSEGRRMRGTGSRNPPKYVYGQLGRAMAAALSQRRESGSDSSLRKEMNAAYFFGYLYGWMVDA